MTLDPIILITHVRLDQGRECRWVVRVGDMDLCVTYTVRPSYNHWNHVLSGWVMNMCLSTVVTCSQLDLSDDRPHQEVLFVIEDFYHLIADVIVQYWLNEM